MAGSDAWERAEDAEFWERARLAKLPSKDALLTKVKDLQERLKFVDKALRAGKFKGLDSALNLRKKNWR